MDEHGRSPEPKDEQKPRVRSASVFRKIVMIALASMPAPACCGHGSSAAVEPGPPADPAAVRGNVHRGGARGDAGTPDSDPGSVAIYGMPDPGPVAEYGVVIPTPDPVPVPAYGVEPIPLYSVEPAPEYAAPVEPDPDLTAEYMAPMPRDE